MGRTTKRRIHMRRMVALAAERRNRTDKSTPTMAGPPPSSPEEEELEVKLEFGEVTATTEMDLEFESVSDLAEVEIGVADKTDIQLSIPPQVSSPPPSAGSRFAEDDPNLPCLLCRTLIPNPGPCPNSKMYKTGARAMFLLRQILAFPAVRCSSFKRNYGHPSEWIVLCAACAPMVKEASDLFHEMEKLRARYDQLRDTLKNLILAEGPTFPNNIGACAIRRIANAVRSFVKLTDKQRQGPNRVQVEPKRKGKLNNKGGRPSPAVLQLRKKEETIVPTCRRDRTRNTRNSQKARETVATALEAPIPIEQYPTLDFGDALLGEEICPQGDPEYDEDPLKIEFDESTMESDLLEIETDLNYHPSPFEESGEVDDPQEFTISPKKARLEKTKITDLVVPKNLPQTTRVEKTKISDTTFTAPPGLGNASPMENQLPQKNATTTTTATQDKFTTSSKNRITSRPARIRITESPPKDDPHTTNVEKTKFMDSPSKPVPPPAMKKLLPKKPPTPTTPTTDDLAAFALLPIPITPTWTWLDFIAWRTTYASTHAKTNPRTYSRSTATTHTKIPPLSWLAAHYSITTFPCPHCALTFPTLSTWSSHESSCPEKPASSLPLNTIPPGGYKCPTSDSPCSLHPPIPVTPSWTWLNFIAWRKTYARTHSRTTPPTPIPTLTFLAAHYSITTFPCPHCSLTFPSLPPWSAHESSCPHNTTPGFKCPTCRKHFTVAVTLELHMRKKHLPLDALTCTSCGVHFLEIAPFNEHVATFPACRALAVPCKFGPHEDYFPSLAAHEVHIAARHPPESALPYVCPHCPKRYGFASARERHIAAIHNVTMVMCEICGTRLKEGALKGHMKVVHKSREPGAKRYTCEICGRGLISQHRLNRHKQIHIRPEDAQHLCTQCGKRFRLKEYLAIHMNSHDPGRKGYYKGRGKGDPERRGMGGAKIGRPPVKKRKEEGEEANEKKDP